jgi:hypothetical protein
MFVTNSCSIPVELLLEVKPFLLKKDYWKFLGSSKKLFAEIRFATRDIVLFLSNDVVEFFEQATFRDQILSKISSPINQLTIVLGGFEDRLNPDQLNLCSIPFHSLSVGNISLNSFLKCQNFVFSSHYHLEVADLPFLSQFPSINNIQSMKIERCSSLHDISSLSSLTSLSLSDCNEITNINCLLYLQELKITRCPRIRDINQLGKISRLSISECLGVEDMSGLQSNNYLHIEDCPFIALLPAQMDCRRFESNLSLSDLEQISFPKLRSLSLLPASRSSITAIQNPMESSLSFTGLFSVKLYRCSSMTSLKGLKRVSVVSLIDCPLLSDISDLGENQAVLLEDCPKVVSFRPLHDVPSVSLISCRSFVDGAEVAGVRHLSIRTCGNCKDLSILGEENAVHHLELYSWMESLTGLGEIPILEIGFQPGKNSISSYLQSLGGRKQKKIVLGPSWNCSSSSLNMNFPFIGYYDVVRDNDSGKCVLLRKER